MIIIKTLNCAAHLSCLQMRFEYLPWSLRMFRWHFIMLGSSLYRFDHCNRCYNRLARSTKGLSQHCLSSPCLVTCVWLLCSACHTCAGRPCTPHRTAPWTLLICARSQAHPPSCQPGRALTALLALGISWYCLSRGRCIDRSSLCSRSCGSAPRFLPPWLYSARLASLCEIRDDRSTSAT